MKFVDHLFIFAMRNKRGMTSIAVRWPKEKTRDTECVAKPEIT